VNVAAEVRLPGPTTGEVARTQAGTTALMTLIAVALWVLARLARPCAWWKITLVAAMVTVSALMFVLPPSRRLFLLDPDNLGHTGIAALSAVIAIVVLELAWWMTGRRR
jgi:cation-transporting ATPase E